jgi:hypothetical protein
MYAPVEGEPFPVPAVKLSDIDPAFLRKAVYYPTNEAPGTIVKMRESLGNVNLRATRVD